MTLIAVGLLSPVATAQSERIIAPEDRDTYVSEFQYDVNNPPVVDGVGGLTEAEIAEIQDKIQQAEASGPPQDEIIPGQMWSDKVGIPEGYDKTEADRSEVAIATEQSQPQARTFMATAERCKSFWLIPFKVCGEILDRYEALGGETSWLLLPIEHQSINPDGQGHRQRFVGGVIYQHPDTGAHAVSPMTMALWQRHGWEAGWLGYPLGGEVPVEGSTTIDGEISGWVQQFQGGRVYRTPILEGFQIASINGVILDKWLELGGPSGYLGFPIADEAGVTDGMGRFSIFQRGEIYWAPGLGAHAVSGTILDDWKSAEGPAGDFGYPIAPMEWVDEFTYIQSFEGGEIQGEVSQGFAPRGLTSQYIQADSQEEADAYFDAIEDEWIVESLGSPGISLMQKGAPVTYGPCILKPNNIHIRTKSGESDFGIVGFKPSTTCTKPVSSIQHTTNLRYKYYQWWLKAASATAYSDPGLTTTLVQKNIEHHCRGHVDTWFWGTAAGVINYGGKEYYARVYPDIARFSCRV